MEKVKREILMWRWSAITAGLIACFWTIWYVIAGQVPTLTNVKMTTDWTIDLPFEISRWWDVLIGPIWSIIIISIFTNEKVRKNKDLVFGLAFGLVFGLVFGLAFGLALGLAFTLGAGLVFGLVVGLAFGLGFGLGTGLASGLASGLAVGLIVGLGTGLASGLVVGLGTDLASGLAICLLFFLKLLFKKKFWQRVGNWLVVK